MPVENMKVGESITVLRHSVPITFELIDASAFVSRERIEAALTEAKGGLLFPWVRAKTGRPAPFNPMVLMIGDSVNIPIYEPAVSDPTMGDQVGFLGNMHFVRTK